MTPALVHARVACLAVPVLLAGGFYVGATMSWWLLVPGIYSAALMSWCATREYALHRRTRAEHEIARRLTIMDELGSDPSAELHAACCTTWFVFRSADHTTACPIARAQRRARGEAA